MPLAAKGQIIALTAIDDIVTIKCEQSVPFVSAVEFVITASTGKEVEAVVAEQHVWAIASNESIVSRSTDEVIGAGKS